MPKIRHIFHIDSSLEKVFEHISKIDHIKKWWTAETSGSDEVGRTIDFKFEDRGFIQVCVDELVEGEKILWTCTDGDPQWHGTTMEFYLTKNEEEKLCRVNFIHDGWAEATEFMGICSFSWAKYFISLKSLCESGVGEPYK